MFKFCNSFGRFDLFRAHVRASAYGFTTESSVLIVHFLNDLIGDSRVFFEEGTQTFIDHALDRAFDLAVTGRRLLAVLDSVRGAS